MKTLTSFHITDGKIILRINEINSQKNILEILKNADYKLINKLNDRDFEFTKKFELKDFSQLEGTVIDELKSLSIEYSDIQISLVKWTGVIKDKN